MKYLRKFETFISTAKLEGASPDTSPGTAEPEVIPDTDTPTKPQRPEKPGKITRPSVDPDPKAVDDKEVTALHVANRFIEESNKNGESVKKYLK